MNKFYFTTPLYYPNARLHAGHAYTTLVCDAFARYKRLCGYDVAFLTGTDEHGEKLERAAEAAGMSPQAFLDRLLKLYHEHPEFVRPDFRLNEVRSFVKSGLHDISISRKRIKWGVPWPDDPEQVFYVWYDALTGYLTGIGYGEAEGGSAEFRKYWPADFHMVGKDIIRFHAVYWPAFLMAAG